MCRSGGLDFIYGDAFPHDTDMDQLTGVDFDKGCFVGQEVVSRIEHRGTARTRVVPVRYDGFAPEAGMPVSAGEKAVGTLGSTAQGRGLPCCVSTGSPTRSRPGNRWSPAAWKSSSSSRRGRALHFRAR